MRNSSLALFLQVSLPKTHSLQPCLFLTLEAPTSLLSQRTLFLPVPSHTSSHPLGLFSFCILFAYSQAWSSVASWCLSSASYLLIFSLVLDPGAEGRWGAGREVPTVQGDISQCPDQWSYMLKEHLFHLHANLAYTGLQERKGGERKLSCLLLLCQC